VHAVARGADDGVIGAKVPTDRPIDGVDQIDVLVGRVKPENATGC